jgi:uncharacterized repeat protein (TIGR03803 family)
MAQTERVLYNFCSAQNCADGSAPVSSLLIDANGNLFGTAAEGGITGGLCQAPGCGTVFERTRAGALKILYKFSGNPDGISPQASLIEDANGNLYGTTAYGGNTGACGTYGCGTIFELVNNAGTYSEKILYAFSGGSDGATPRAALLRDASGNLYGTTSVGGNTTCQFGCGTVFKITSSGAEQTLYAFTGGADGATPDAGLIDDSAGNLYGTAMYAGRFGGGCSTLGCGVIFRITPAGRQITLYRFKGRTDGEWPRSSLLRDSSGNLFGTTVSGGGTGNVACSIESNGCGVVFELTKGTLRTVYAFKGYPGDGQNPSAALVSDALGNLYGTSYRGGPSNDGTVFKITPDGAETVLHNFAGGRDGLSPEAAPSFDTQGNLYGTALYGGRDGLGVLFRVVP